MRKFAIALVLLITFSSFAFAAQLYVNNFEADALGAAPRGWELGFEGSGVGSVIADPLEGGERVGD